MMENAFHVLMGFTYQTENVYKMDFFRILLIILLRSAILTVFHVQIHHSLLVLCAVLVVVINLKWLFLAIVNANLKALIWAMEFVTIRNIFLF